MDGVKEFLELLRIEGDRSEVLGLWQVLIAFGMSFLSAVVVARLYRRTHRGAGYSQSFVQTLVLVSLVTTLIMIVVGSSIARAFSLLGALSIIRFRNAVKETRDVGYLFCAMALAMAAGTQFYGVGLVALCALWIAMSALHLLDFGAPLAGREHRLRVELASGDELEAVLGETLRGLFESYRVMRVESSQQGLAARVFLSVRPRPGTGAEQVVAAIQAANEGRKVSYDVDQHTEPL